MSIMKDYTFPKADIVDPRDLGELIMATTLSIDDVINDENAERIGKALSLNNEGIILKGLQHVIDDFFDLQNKALNSNIVFDMMMLSHIGVFNARIVSFLMKINISFIGEVELTVNVLDKHRERYKQIDKIIKTNWEWQDKMLERYIKANPIYHCIEQESKD